MAGDWHPRRVVFPSLEDDENEPMTHSHGTSPVYVPIIWMVDFYEVNVGKYTYVRPMDPSWDMGLNWKVSGFRGSKRVRLKVWKVSTPTHLFGFAMCCFTWRRDLFWSLKDLFITKNSTLDLKELAALNGCQSKTQEFIFLIPRDPITSWEWKWNPNNMVRCLNIPIIIWEYDWMPRVYHAWNGVFTVWWLIGWLLKDPWPSALQGAVWLRLETRSSCFLELQLPIFYVGMLPKSPRNSWIIKNQNDHMSEKQKKHNLRNGILFKFSKLHE